MLVVVDLAVNGGHPLEGGPGVVVPVLPEGNPADLVDG